MALQMRTVVPPVSGAAYAKEVTRLLEATAAMLLAGVPVHRYEALQARYQVLNELVRFAEDRAAATEKGDVTDDD